MKAIDFAEARLDDQIRAIDLLLEELDGKVDGEPPFFVGIRLIATGTRSELAAKRRSLSSSVRLQVSASDYREILSLACRTARRIDHLFAIHRTVRG